MGRSLTDSLTAATEVVIEGAPSLTLSIRDSADPTPAEREFDYDVVIQNHGNAAARDMRVEFAPVGLEIVSVSGSLGGAVRDGKYTPPPIAELPSNGRVAARLRVKAAKNGDARMIVRLTASVAGEQPAGRVRIDGRLQAVNAPQAVRRTSVFLLTHYSTFTSGSLM